MARLINHHLTNSSAFSKDLSAQVALKAALILVVTGAATKDNPCNHSVVTASIIQSALLIFHSSTFFFISTTFCLVSSTQPIKSQAAEVTSAV